VGFQKYRAACGRSSGHLLPSFIDPYGDTMFNYIQIPVLIPEITALVDRSVDKEGKSTLQDLLAYVRSACDRRYVYVRFLGD
jgi:hypothetical protein